MRKTREPLLSELISLSNRLGDPAMDCAILAEGNTSVRVDEQSFFIKTSGANLQSAGTEQFVEVRFDPILQMLDCGTIADDEIRRVLQTAMVTPREGVVPSIESLLHAVCLSIPEVSFVGHTHPTAVNMITCSTSFDQALKGRIFPDEVVLCGPSSVLVPYVDPGVPLAHEVRRQIDQYLSRWGTSPRVIYMQNHGLIALGNTVRQVLDITSMAVKSARIRVGALAAGGLNFLSEEDVYRICRRPDELHRQLVLGSRSVRT